jgi:hypothetical protein
MQTRSIRIPTFVAIVMGVVAGWALTTVSTTPIRASAGDRSGQVIVATGPVLVTYDEAMKVPIPLDALYLLDYSSGRLLASIPAFSQVGSKSRMIDKFMERDLVVDFELERLQVKDPRFVMTTGSLGAYNGGWAPVYVFETISKQLVVYRMQVAQSMGTVKSAQFELMQKTIYGKMPDATVNQP